MHLPLGPKNFFWAQQKRLTASFYRNKLSIPPTLRKQKMREVNSGGNSLLRFVWVAADELWARSSRDSCSPGPLNDGEEAGHHRVEKAEGTFCQAQFKDELTLSAASFQTSSVLAHSLLTKAKMSNCHYSMPYCPTALPVSYSCSLYYS
jgi:hypothetical protein